MARTGELTDLQRRFVDEYLIDLNATAAYKRAGYRARSDNAAAVEGHKLLRNPKIAAAIAAAQAERAERVQVKADDVLRELALLAFSDIGQILNFEGDTVRLRAPGDISEGARRAVAAIKVKRVWEGTGDDKVPVDVMEFKLWGKEPALKMVGEHLGMFVKKVAPTDPTGEKEYGGGLTHEERLARILAVLEQASAGRRAPGPAAGAAGGAGPGACGG